MMNQSEWLTSSDPVAMLRQVDRNLSKFLVSDLKLRLFACACGKRCGKDEPSMETISSEKAGNFDQSLRWAMRWADPAAPTWDVPNRPTQQEKANFLRCIIGNPWRPVTMPESCSRCGKVDGKMHKAASGEVVCVEGSVFVTAQCRGLIRCSWLTPDAIAIARKAYDERPGRKCEECVDGDVGCSVCEGAGIYYDPPYSLNRLKCPHCNDGLLPDKCKNCHGTERIDDGTLDPVTLSILADALEEAGCNVGRVHAYKDGGTAFWWNDSFPDECHLTPDRAAIHPIVAHLRSPEPHVRGCWAIDLVLGKE